MYVTKYKQPTFQSTWRLAEAEFIIINRKNIKLFHFTTSGDRKTVFFKLIFHVFVWIPLQFGQMNAVTTTFPRFNSPFVRKLVIANQRSERLFSHVKKTIRPIRIANDVFSRVRKMIRPIRSHRGVGVSRQNSRLIATCSAASHTFINEKSFTQGVFLAKKVKNISEMEWNSFVCFTVDKKIR